MLEHLRSDATLSAEERSHAEELVTKISFSQMLKNPEFAADVDGDIRFRFSMYEWMIRLFALSIASGIGFFFFGQEDDASQPWGEAYFAYIDAHFLLGRPPLNSPSPDIESEL